MPDSPLERFLDGRSRRARFTVRPESPSELEPVGDLLAGAAETDITPPPGMPKAGYSSNARNGTGFRSRLRARVVHLRSGVTSLALVQCDLLGGSAVVQHLVAQRIAPSTDVALAGLFMGATHTHAAPGQFLGTDFYNRFASNRPGFDPAWAHFLVERIAGAVERAVAERRPARLALGRAEVWGLTRSRSLRPHVRNPEVGDKRTAPQRKFVAINPLLHLLRVDARAAGGGFEPLSANVVFSVHGTGIPNRSDLYNADVWAYLYEELAHRIEGSHGTRPVVGAMEGTHADVAPALRPGQAGHLESARIGRAVGAEAAALYGRMDGRLTGSVELGAGLQEVDLTRSRAVDGIVLPRRPAVGAALVAGAHENTTPVIHRIPPFRAGVPKHRGAGGPQGPKWVLGGRRGQPLVLPLGQFPRVLPIQVLRIGPALVVGLPFELTVETGRRIEAAVTAAIGVPGGDDRVGDGEGGIDRVIVSSVANEYSGYATTPEEYALQHYEGGHTLYGPQTQPFLAAHAARLARRTVTAGMVQDGPAERRFDLRTHRYLLAPSGDGIHRRALEPVTFADPTASSDARWESQWEDTGPENLVWHHPMVRVEAAGRDGRWELAVHHGRPVDDQGNDVEVRYLGATGTGHRYAARWWDPAFAGGRRHRFVLLANGGQPELASPPFD